MNSLAMLASANLIFNISLHKFLCKFTASNKKKTTLIFNYFKSNFTLIKNVCKTHVDLFCEKK